MGGVGTIHNDMPADSRAARDVTDAHVLGLVRLMPDTATYLGVPVGQGEISDMSPQGRAAPDDLSRATLRDRDRAERGTNPLGDSERRRGRPLRECLDADLAKGTMRVRGDDRSGRKSAEMTGVRSAVKECHG